eukprot:CAMPEP_0113423178 /NCGR_PEP_ID=MMETSP0013_2-20120614/28875_1 /TAXON_ID=2843 ORGANISM="Skeletonema costatum, Strain 1716" /NCGR_SAMPLE_ID=MMETSP0013_2 /ASSEMBLY_ACC=CAM_ASM_000158 /LENGTH=189 /DNA_ID=CAMNT_0000311011 /DNA_START=11 /DNA_END=580 /DNA_ORIENTATION=- /assembly_acc=CAM_ASM_000158
MAPLTLSLPSIKSATTATAVILLTGMIIQQRQVIKNTYRSCRGMEGLLRYVWIGDFLPPHIREAMDKLDNVNERMVEAETKLEEIEILIERVELESVDGPRRLPEEQDQDTVDNKEEFKKQLFQRYPELRTKIGLFSSSLDKLAYTIDSINSHRDADVKTRKKQLSNKIVELMNSLDRMVSSLNLGVRL